MRCGHLDRLDHAGARVARELMVLIARRTKSGLIVGDNGSSLDWQRVPAAGTAHRIGGHCIASGTSMQTGFVARLHGRIRNGLRNRTRFPKPGRARTVSAPGAAGFNSAGSAPHGAERRPPDRAGSGSHQILHGHATTGIPFAKKGGSRPKKGELCRQPICATEFHGLISHPPLPGQISGSFKLLPAPADQFRCC